MTKEKTNNEPMTNNEIVLNDMTKTYIIDNVEMLKRITINIDEPIHVLERVTTFDSNGDNEESRTFKVSFHIANGLSIFDFSTNAISDVWIKFQSNIKKNWQTYRNLQNVKITANKKGLSDNGKMLKNDKLQYAQFKTLYNDGKINDEQLLSFIDGDYTNKKFDISTVYEYVTGKTYSPITDQQ